MKYTLNFKKFADEISAKKQLPDPDHQTVFLRKFLAGDIKDISLDTIDKILDDALTCGGYRFDKLIRDLSNKSPFQRRRRVL